VNCEYFVLLEYSLRVLSIVLWALGGPLLVVVVGLRTVEQGHVFSASSPSVSPWSAVLYSYKLSVTLTKPVYSGLMVLE
jgi:hypothetical protein